RKGKEPGKIINPLEGKKNIIEPHGKTDFQLFHDFYSLPKGDVIGNFFGSFFRVFISPSSISIDIFSDSYVIIASCSFPRTGRSSGGRLKKLPIKRRKREIMIVFDNNCFIRLG